MTTTYPLATSSHASIQVGPQPETSPETQAHMQRVRQGGRLLLALSVRIRALPTMHGRESLGHDVQLGDLDLPRLRRGALLLNSAVEHLTLRTATWRRGLEVHRLSRRYSRHTLPLLDLGEPPCMATAPASSLIALPECRGIPERRGRIPPTGAGPQTAARSASPRSQVRAAALRPEQERRRSRPAGPP